MINVHGLYPELIWSISGSYRTLHLFGRLDLHICLLYVHILILPEQKDPNGSLSPMAYTILLFVVCKVNAFVFIKILEGSCLRISYLRAFVPFFFWSINSWEISSFGEFCFLGYCVLSTNRLSCNLGGYYTILYLFISWFSIYSLLLV